ncbi:MAG: DUF192 domain-containing protein [Betaproteobacteria bacterium]|nr:DUF192 domain-containing protein [Betaproteobacteria bacterium]PWB65717.1 MAG: hypothetical protein C3F16_02485 [Betaproteobacteria bacterium]
MVAALVPRAAARALAAFALAFAFAAPAHAVSKFIPVKVAGHALRVEVAATVEQRMQGLMFRTKLGADDGMLFVFDEPGYHSMWMKNTPLPLSVAFVDGEGRILNILDMEPQTLDSHYAAGPARFAIETHKGWFARRGIKAGDKVTGLPKVK